jgi:integrase
MTSNVVERGGRFQLRLKHRLLPHAFFHTFDTAAEAATYRDQLKVLLAAGIIPKEMADRPPAGDNLLVIEIIRAYTQGTNLTDSDDNLLSVMLPELARLRERQITVAWVEQYVATLKLKSNFAPGTIRKRVGALARVIDWHLRRTTAQGTALAVNPLRNLPVGYSHYSRVEASKLTDKQVVKVDVSRDRRLTSKEEAQVRHVLGGGLAPGARKRLKIEAEFTLLFDLILDTGMRLQEAYTLRVDQLEDGYLKVEGSKGARGKLKPRTVPLRPVMAKLLKARAAEVEEGRMFPWWDGDLESRKKTSAYLSKRFEQMFRYAGVVDFHEHDLRHEATVRWITMKKDGRWIFTDTEVAKIMGWTGAGTMLLRYASFRGEDLAARLM